MGFNFNRKRFAYGADPVLRRDFLRGTKTHDFGSIATTANAETTIDVPGAAVGDDVLVSTPGGAPTPGIILSARVTAANVVTLRAQNVTAGAVDPASMLYSVRVLKLY